MQKKLLFMVLGLILWQGSYASENKSYYIIKKFFQREDKGALAGGLFSGAIMLGRTMNSAFSPWQSAGYTIASSAFTYCIFDTVFKKITPFIIKNENEENN